MFYMINNPSLLDIKKVIMLTIILSNYTVVSSAFRTFGRDTIIGAPWDNLIRPPKTPNASFPKPHQLLNYDLSIIHILIARPKWRQVLFMDLAHHELRKEINS